MTCNAFFSWLLRYLWFDVHYGLSQHTFGFAGTRNQLTTSTFSFSHQRRKKALIPFHTYTPDVKLL